MQAYDGDGIHLKIQNIFKEQGILVEAEQSITDEDYHVKGKPDAVINLSTGLCLLDIKTQNQKAWARRKEDGKRTVVAGHRKQILLYKILLKKHRYPDLDDCRVYYINRNTGEREEFKLFFTDQEEKEIKEELTVLNEFFDKQEMPPCTCDPKNCPFCEYPEQCHGGVAPTKGYSYRKKKASSNGNGESSAKVPLSL
jgi:CRISPR/Cas system-associated exonuclease Cas4 (RecB family)